MNYLIVLALVLTKNYEQKIVLLIIAFELLFIIFNYRKNIDFNNTIELNSSIYFCRVNHNEFNYSSNPTYVDASKLVVKNTIDDLPVSYITTVGLYSPDNELLAVAKLSEPLRKDPNTELTLRVRLDY